MPGGGRLTLTTRLSLDTLFGGRVDAGTGPRPLVEVQVSDEGEGIPPELLDRVFDPFVTTKPRGLGLGLALAHRIVEEHRGALRVASTPGKGTTFSAHLPIAPTAGVRPVRAAGPAGGGPLRPDRRRPMTPARILVADDEPSMRWLLERVLRQAGHSVTVVEDGAGALAQAGAEPYDLAFVDVRMPERGRARGALAAEDPRPRHGRDRDDGPRQRALRGRGDAARRLRLPHQAVRQRRGAAPGRARALGARAGARGRGAPDGDPGGLGVRRAGRQVSPDAGGLQDHRADRRDRRDRPPAGRVGDGQGGRGARHPPLQPAGRASRSWPSPARRSRRPSSSPSSSATSAGRSRTRTSAGSAASSWRRAARCTSTRSGIWGRSSSRSSCGCSRSGSSSGSAAARRSPSTSASSRRRTATSRRSSGTGASARTSTTG